MIGDEFYKRFSIDLLSNPYFLKDKWKIAIQEKDEDTMKDVLYIECKLYFYKHNCWRPNDYYIEDIHRLIKEYWHRQHEELLDILISIGDDKRNESVLIDILHTTFPYYEDQEEEETFMVPIWSKCIWELASIGTPTAIKCVKELRNSPYEYIRNTVNDNMNYMDGNNREIRAIYNAETIRVYQAYNNIIADEAIMLNKFGNSFSMNRMTWIKPSFLWMMYRSGWATKQGQNRILAIDMDRIGFEEIVVNAVTSTFDDKLYSNIEEWKNAIKDSEVRIQWDPERDIFGNPSKNKRSIQIGIRGKILQQFNNKWIKRITDITHFVQQQKRMIDDQRFDLLSLPQEKVYQFSFVKTKQ